MVKSNYRESDLVFASKYARDEANRWRILVKKILESPILNREAYILFLYSSEIYLKCLLMSLNVDVINNVKNDGHNLYSLYQALSDSPLKNAIKENIDINPLVVDENNKKLLNSFEDFLEEVSMGFVHYRYEYEKFLNNSIITLSVLFIESLNNTLSAICNGLVYEAVNEEGKIVEIR